MNTQSCPRAKQNNVEDQAIPPATNARLVWTQEAGSTTEPQRRHEAELQSTHVRKSKSASLRTSGLLQTCCVSYWP